MAKFGAKGSIRLRESGKPANIVALVGEAYKVPLTYAGADGEAIDLSDWEVTAKAELYRAQWDGDDNLVALYGRRIGEPVEVAAEVMEDQTANKGVFLLQVDSALLPNDKRAVAIGTDYLPTYACWIRLAGPGMVVVQARAAIGFRRGEGSLA